MRTVRRLGMPVAFLWAVLAWYLAPAIQATPAREALAVEPAAADDPEIAPFLSENVHLSKDRSTIYWSLQSLSTLPKPRDPGESQYSGMGGDSGFTLDFGSLDLQSLVGVQVLKDINTVILTMKSGRKEDLVKVLDVIRTLDRPRKQVLIRVMVAEVSTDRSQQVHHRIRMLNKGLGGDEDLSSEVSVDQGVIPDVAESRNTPGFQWYAVKDQAVRSFLTMQKTDGQFEVLSNPQVVVKHGEKAKIMVGSKINMVSGETSVSGNTVQVAQYADQNIGLEFMVTPFIYGNGEVGLDISQSMTELTLAGTDLKNIETNRRQVQTFASTKSGNTVVLGGMLQTRETHSESGVPVLRKIPLLGRLFVDHRRQTKEVDLMVFITPFILDGPAGAQAAAPLPGPETASRPSLPADTMGERPRRGHGGERETSVSRTGKGSTDTMSERPSGRPGGQHEPPASGGAGGPFPSVPLTGRTGVKSRAGR